VIGRFGLGSFFKVLASPFRKTFQSRGLLTAPLLLATASAAASASAAEIVVAIVVKLAVVADYWRSLEADSAVSASLPDPTAS
jgi:ABC-type sugar transport system substrate-binding protein